MRYLGSILLFASSLSAAPSIAIVLNSGDETLYLIDYQGQRQIKRVPIGKEPHHLMATPDDKFVRQGPDFGQRIWDVQSPKGWPDEDTVWAAPYAVLERADWADAVGRRAAGTRDVMALADDVMGPRLAPETLAGDLGEVVVRAPQDLPEVRVSATRAPIDAPFLASTDDYAGNATSPAF